MAYTPKPVMKSNFSANSDGWTGVVTQTGVNYNNAVAEFSYNNGTQSCDYTTPIPYNVANHYYFNAPNGFLGNKFMLKGGFIEYGIRLNGNGTAMVLNQNLNNLLLYGNGKFLGNNVFNGTPDPITNTANYTVKVELKTGKGWKLIDGNTNPDATDNDLQEVLRDLTRIVILGSCATNLTSTNLFYVSQHPYELPGNPMPLEIHTINVSQGDSILIINRNLYLLRKVIEDWIATKPMPQPTLPADSADWMPFAVAQDINITNTLTGAVLIDAGNKEFGYNAIQYMQAHGVLDDQYSVVVSHYHDDHYDGFIYSKDKAGSITTADVVFSDFPPAKIYDCGNDNVFNPMTYKVNKIKNNFQRYKTNIHDLATNSGVTYQALVPNNIIEIGKWFDPVNLRCVAANGYVWSGFASVSHRPNPAKKEEQNSRSVALVLEYGDFRYYLAGDLGGAETKDNSKTNGYDYGTKQAVGSKGYWDIEIPLAGYLPAIYQKANTRPKTVAGHICSIKCSHHGSQWHTNTRLLMTMQPKVCVISSGLKKSFHKHPTQEALDRLDYDTANVGTTTENVYSPNWPDRTSGAPNTINQVANTLKDTTSPADYYFYITEMKKQINAGKKKFVRTYPHGKLVGSVVVRPRLEDILNIMQNPQVNNQINIQIYGNGLASDHGKANQYNNKLSDLEAKNANYPNTTSYPVGPWTHVCDKH